MSNGTLVAHEFIEIAKLKPHPRNEEIYGDPRQSQDFASFVQDVKENGIHPLLVADDMTIIGGHRRYYAALQLGIEEVDAVIFHYATETDKLAALIADNNVRIKSNWQLASEAEALIGIAAERAKERQAQQAIINNPRLQNSEPVHTSNGRAADEVGEQLGVSGRTVSDMLLVKDAYDDLVTLGLHDDAEELVKTVNKSVKAAAQKAKRHRKAQEQSPKQEASAKEAIFNKQDGDNIEWARWSWNPVTGCLHSCSYCYARDIAERFTNAFPKGFEPMFREERLSAPANTNVPNLASMPNEIDRVGWRNVFTCSMADLFGKWVPAEWIHAVLKEVADNPQWTFLFLTKFPIRMAEFDFPPNTWIGTTVDTQYAVERAEKAFRKIRAGGYRGVAWLSCEPMMERLTFTSLEMFDWVVMGGASKSTQTPAFAPPVEWWIHLWNQAKLHNIPVYMKTNLVQKDGIAVDFDSRWKEYPV